MYSPYGFSALRDQNSADTQARNVAPTMPGYTGLDKQKFADMRTPEDQIHWLYLYSLTLDQNTISQEEAQALIDASAAALKAYIDTQDGIIEKEIAEKFNYLVKLIDSLTEFSGSTFDPTYGKGRSIRIVNERIYDLDRVFAITALECDNLELTVAEWNELAIKAREYDVIAALMLDSMRARV